MQEGQSHKTAPTWMLLASSKPPELLTDYESGSHNPLTSLIICYNSSQNSGKHFSNVGGFIIKDTIKTSQMAEMHKTRCVCVGDTEFPCPLWHHLPSKLMCSLTRNSEFHYSSVCIVLSLQLLPLFSEGQWGWKFQLCNHWLVLVTSHPENV